jgi:hypothetical protein
MRVFQKKYFGEFLDDFGLFSIKKMGAISTKVYSPHLFESKIGSKAPKNRQKICFETPSIAHEGHKNL